MLRTRFRVVSGIVVGLAAAALASQALPTLRLVAGQAAQGEIAFDGEEDRIAVDLLAGAKLSFTAKTSKKSTLHPAVDLYVAAGTPTTVADSLRVSKATSASINNWPAPATGTYLLGVHGGTGGGTGGATGLYDLTTKVKAAPAPKPATGAISAGGEIDAFSFDALSGTKATLTVKRAKGSKLTPRVESVIAPDGSTVPLTGVARKSSATSDALKNLTLTQFGTYGVRVRGDAGSTGGYSRSFGLKAPSAPKTKLDFRGASGGEATAGDVTSIEIVPNTLDLAVGRTRQLLAKVTYADGRVRDGTRVVTWGSRDRRVLTVANGTTCGFATGVAAGGTTIEAWADAVEAREILALVGGATVTGISIVPASPVVAPGDTIALQAVATMSTGDPVDVTGPSDWADFGGVAVTLAGSRVTAGSTPGVAQVTASVGGSESLPHDVTVTTRRVERIVVAPAYAEIASGTRAFTAVATYSDGATTDVTSSAAWLSDDLAAATMSGATATFVAPGTAGVRATLDGVTSRPAVLNCGPVALQSVVVHGTAAVPAGATRSFTADAVFADGGTRDVTEAAIWSSSAPAIVSVDATVAIRGRVHGVATVGNASITATLSGQLAGTAGGQSVVAAVAAERKRLFVMPRIGSVAVDETIVFRAYFERSDGSLEDVSSSADWLSSTPGTATVNAGTITGEADGGAEIAASLDGKTARSVVFVGVGHVVGFNLSQAVAAPVGDSVKAFGVAAFEPFVGGGASVGLVTDAASWFSDDPTSVPIDATGLASMRRVGTAHVFSVFAGLESVTVQATGATAAERSLRVFPQLARSPAGGDVQLAAQVTSSDGSVADLAASSTWNSDTPAKATVNATGLVHAAAKGSSVISAVRAGSGVTDATTFTTLSDPPSISSVSPPTFTRGTSANLVTINGASLDGAGLAVTFSGTGVTSDAAPVPNADGSQATVAVSVSSGAATGLRDLTYATVSGSATKTNAVMIVAPPPTIASVSPTNIDVPGAGSTNTTLTATGTNFLAGDAFTLPNVTGVSVSNLQVVNATTMTGTVTVQSSAQRARLDVTVVQSAGAGGQTATLPSALKIGPADPTVSDFTPAYVSDSPHRVTGQVTGTNFNAGISASFANTSSVLTNAAFTRRSSTSLTFQADVVAGAAPGLYDLVLQNSGDITKTFAGKLVLAPADPTVLSFSAQSLSRGISNVSVDILGTNFRTGDSVSASGGGVSFSNTTIVSSERIAFVVAVGSTATISMRDVTVSHAASVGGRGATLTNAFRVTDSAPTVTSCVPARVGRTGSGGPTRRVPIVVTGTNFCVGATVAVTSSSGSGLSVGTSTTTVLSDTQIAIGLDVAGTATVGTWDVAVTNPASLGNSGSTGAAKLTVSSETTLTVNNVLAATGSAQGDERVTVRGAGFVRGLVIDFGTERAVGTQFIDQNTAVCTVPPPANPSTSGGTSVSTTATTYVSVKATNPSAANTTLANGYGYLANQTLFKILQSWPADSSSNVPQNLKSAVVRLSDYAKTNTAVQGSTRGAQCQWFENGGFTLASQSVGFGADRRFLVFSHPAGGNLPTAQNGTSTPGRYVLETATAVKSAAGAALVPAKLAQTLNYDQWFFTLSTSTTDSTAPTLTTIAPANNATGVPTTTVVSLTFSEEIDPLTVTTNSITLTPAGGSASSCFVALSNDLKTVTLTPSAELAAGTGYSVAVTGTIADLFGNAFSSASRVFTTGSGADTTAPTIDSVVIEQIPANMDGSTTYVAGTDTPNTVVNNAQAFRLYLPKSGWKVAVSFSDTGGAGVDESQFSAKASVAVGSVSANTELASKFAVTGADATWTVGASDAFAAGDNATLTFTIKDKSSNTSTQKVVAFDVVDINATAQGAGGGDLDVFNSRETWVLRFDRDVYTANLSANGTTQQCTTTAAGNGVADIEEAMRISGLATANMTTDCANTVNGPSVGTNAIMVRLFEERLRATLRARYGIGEDGTRGVDAADIEFLLPGEQGSLSSAPTWSAASSGSTAKAYSEMDIGGDTGPNNSQTSAFGTIGLSFLDPRNLNHEADVNDGGAAGSNVGIFAIDMAKAVMNLNSAYTWGAKVLARFQTAKGGTPVGEGTLDDDVLAGTFDRTASGNTQAMNDRYDQIMDAIENSALSVSSVVAHEIGHSLGLVPDDQPPNRSPAPTDGLSGPKRGFFGNANRANTFTEATASLPNTPSHLDALGNDVMAAVSSIDQRAATGTDFMRFSPFDRNCLLNRQVYDEGR